MHKEARGDKNKLVDSGESCPSQNAKLGRAEPTSFQRTNEASDGERESSRAEVTALPAGAGRPLQVTAPFHLSS